MGEAVVVAAWNRIKVLPRHYTQHVINLCSFSSWQFFVVLMISKKISNLYVSWRRVRDLSMAAKNTSIGFKMREKLKLESAVFQSRNSV